MSMHNGTTPAMKPPLPIPPPYPVAEDRVRATLTAAAAQPPSIRSQEQAWEIAQLLQDLRSPAVRDAILNLLRTLSDRPLPMPDPAPPVIAKIAEPAALAATAVGMGPATAPQPLGEAADLAEQLHAALLARQSGLTLNYQPVVDATTGAILGFEALLRWTTPDGKQVPPLRVVDLAARANLLETLDFWVMQQAVSQTRPWLSANPRLVIAINVTAALLTSPLAVSAVRALLRANGVSAANFCIEVPETTLLDQRATNNLAALRRLGLQLAIDDFGTGQSALTRLMDLDVDLVKLDRAFFTAQEQGPRQRSFLGAIVDMAKARGSQVVAEGVATPEDARLAREIGCAACQGFWFAGPLTASAAGSLARSETAELPWQVVARPAR